jgi:hypothetical protein
VIGVDVTDDGQHDPVLDAHVVRCGECGEPVMSSDTYAIIGDDVCQAQCFDVPAAEADVAGGT